MTCPTAAAGSPRPRAQTHGREQLEELRLGDLAVKVAHVQRRVAEVAGRGRGGGGRRGRSGLRRHSSLNAGSWGCRDRTNAETELDDFVGAQPELRRPRLILFLVPFRVLGVVLNALVTQRTYPDSPTLSVDGVERDWGVSYPSQEDRAGVGPAGKEGAVGPRDYRGGAAAFGNFSSHRLPPAHARAHTRQGASLRPDADVAAQGPQARAPCPPWCPRPTCTRAHRRRECRRAPQVPPHHTLPSPPSPIPRPTLGPAPGGWVQATAGRVQGQGQSK